MKGTIIKYYQQKMNIFDCGSIYYLRYCEINYIYYDKPYTHVITIFNNDILLNYSLIKFIENLPNLFLFCNKSTILNSMHLKSLYKKNNYFLIVMENDKIFKVSRRKVYMIKEKLCQVKHAILNCEICIIKQRM